MVYFEDMRFESAIATNSCSAIPATDCKPTLQAGIECTAFMFSGCLEITMFDHDKNVCDKDYACYHISAGVQGLS